MRALLPRATPGHVAYLATLFDLDGDGLVAPDDMLMAFEEIGTAIDTPANKVWGERVFEFLLFFCI